MEKEKQKQKNSESRTCATCNDAPIHSNAKYNHHLKLHQTANTIPNFYCSTLCGFMSTTEAELKEHLVNGECSGNDDSLTSDSKKNVFTKE